MREVCLLRHIGNPKRGWSSYALWQQKLLDPYQRLQKIDNRKKLARPYWASFVVRPPDNDALFVGLYAVRLPPKEKEFQEIDAPAGWPEDRASWLALNDLNSDHKTGRIDVYEFKREDALSERIGAGRRDHPAEGELVIDWGSLRDDGTRARPSPKAWIQHANKRNKPVKE